MAFDFVFGNTSLEPGPAFLCASLKNAAGQNSFSNLAFTRLSRPSIVDTLGGYQAPQVYMTSWLLASIHKGFRPALETPF